MMSTAWHKGVKKSDVVSIKSKPEKCCSVIQWKMRANSQLNVEFNDVFDDGIVLYD